MLLTRLPRVASAQTTVARRSPETTPRWLPSMTPLPSPLKDPTVESKARSETTAVLNVRPPSPDVASTTSACTSPGSRLRS